MATKWLSGLGVLAGVWLFVSPWAFGISTLNPALVGNALVGGLAVGVMMAISFISPVGRRRLSWVLGLGGLWLIVAAVVYGHGGVGASWSMAVVGALVATCGVAFLAEAARGRQVS